MTTIIEPTMKIRLSTPLAAFVAAITLAAFASPATAGEIRHGPMIVVSEPSGDRTTVTYLYDQPCPWREIGAADNGRTHLAVRSDGITTMGGCWSTSSVREKHYATFQAAWKTGAGFTPMTLWRVSTADYRFTEYGNAVLATLQRRDGRTPKFPAPERETQHYSPGM